MVAQLKLDFEIPLDKVRKKRIRFEVPTYKKFYSIWQYDRDKFRELLNEKLKNPEESKYKNQKEILDVCYIRDEKGLKLKDSDEKHIFRAGVLERIYGKIFDYTGIMPNEEAGIIKENGLNIYPSECQAEIEGTWQESIENRLRLHIKLLRLLREGFSVGEAVYEVINAQNKTGAPGYEKAIRK